MGKDKVPGKLFPFDGISSYQVTIDGKKREFRDKKLF
jgi:hypothetical protein